MHEYSLFLSLIEEIRKHLVIYNNCKLKRLILKVGEFSGVDQNYLSQVIETFKTGTFLEEAEIIIERDPFKIECLNCKESSEPSYYRAQCPFCGSYEVKIIGGIDVLLQELELEEEVG